MKQKKGLGRGLDALLGDFSGEEAVVKNIDVRLIDNNPNQPRQYFDREKLEELAASIKEHGVFQPILVIQTGERYKIVAGERRFRAARLAELETVPVIVRELGDAEMFEIALIENIQREDLNPLEEALAIKHLIEEYDLTQEELAKRIGRSRPYITNALRLLTLSPQLQQYLRDGRLQAGHAKLLLSVKDAMVREDIGQKAALRGWSVRELQSQITPPPRSRIEQEKDKRDEKRVSGHVYDPIISTIEETLQKSLATKVLIQGNEKRGKIIIDYYTPQELEALYEILSVGLSDYEPTDPNSLDGLKNT